MMELLETVQTNARAIEAENTVDNFARRAVINNCIGLISDMAREEWEAQEVNDETGKGL